MQTKCKCPDCLSNEGVSPDAKPYAYCDTCLTYCCDTRQALGKPECNVPGAYDPPVPSPSLVSYERQAGDGDVPLRLSFQIKCF